MLLGSRVAAARSFARRGLLFIHDWQGVDAWLREKYGDSVEYALATRGLAVMDEALEALYPGEMESLVEEWVATHPPTPHEVWLERCYAYAETELAAVLGVTVPLSDEVMETYARQWAKLLVDATEKFPKPDGA